MVQSVFIFNWCVELQDVWECEHVCVSVCVCRTTEKHDAAECEKKGTVYNYCMSEVVIQAVCVRGKERQGDP